MPQTTIGTARIRSVSRPDIDVSSDANKALITRVVQGSGITISSTGGVAGTGDVTINADVTMSTLNNYVTTSYAASNFVLKTGDTMTGSLTSTAFIRTGGTSAQFLKADGSLDATTYLSSVPTLTQVLAAGSVTTTTPTFLNVAFYNSGANFTTTLRGYNATSNRTISFPDATGTIALESWVTSRGYLTAESDTLQIVTNRGATTTNNITLDGSLFFGIASNLGRIISNSTYFQFEALNTGGYIFKLNGTNGNALEMFQGANGGSVRIPSLSSGGTQMVVANSSGYLSTQAIPSGSSGTVTSVGISVPTGLSVANSPITTSGTMSITYASGYSIPTIANQNNWNTAYGWGDYRTAFNNMNQAHGTRSDFGTGTDNSYDFGFRYIQGNTNGPGTGSSQFYTLYMGLGSDYPSSSHGYQLALGRYDNYISMRKKEAGVWQGWTRAFVGHADTAGFADNSDFANELNDSSAYMMLRGSIQEANVNSATNNGFYEVLRSGDSQSMLTWNAGGSTGSVQLQADWQGVMRWRNRTDNTNWSAWRVISSDWAQIYNKPSWVPYLYEATNGGLRIDKSVTGTPAFNNTTLELKSYDANKVALSFHRSGYTHVNMWHQDSGWIDTDAGIRVNGTQVVTNTGTWGISITGNASTATSSPLLSALANYVWTNSALPNTYQMGIQSSFVGPGAGEGSFPNYGSVMTMRTYSGGGGSLQLYTPYGPNNGGTGLQVRFGNYDVSAGNSWTAWKTLLASDNYNSYAPTLTGTGASGTWGINVTGTAAGETFSTVTSRGNSTPNHLVINNAEPTIYFQDTDHRSAMIHVNSSNFYVLRGSGNNSTTWAPTANGIWPLRIDLDNNNAYFGGEMVVYGWNSYFSNIKGRDIFASRGDGSGVVYFNDTGTRYIHSDGTNYNFVSANVVIDNPATGGGIVLKGGTFNAGGAGGAVYFTNVTTAPANAGASIKSELVYGGSFEQSNLVFQTSQTERLRINSDGNVYINTVGASTSDDYLTIESNGKITKKTLSVGVNYYTGNHTLTAADNGKVLVFNNTSSANITYPTGLPLGFNCVIIQNTTNALGVFPASGTTIVGFQISGGCTTIGQYATCTLVSKEANTGHVSGDITGV